MLDVLLRDFLSWSRVQTEEMLPLGDMETIKKVYTSENESQLSTQRHIDTSFEIRVPPVRLDSDSSYYPSDVSDSSDITSFASNLSGDSSSLTVASNDEVSPEYDFDDVMDSIMSDASQIGWDTV